MLVELTQGIRVPRQPQQGIVHDGILVRTVAGAFLIIFDFFSYARRHRMIINEDFPKAANQLEEDYLELVAGL